MSDQPTQEAHHDHPHKEVRIHIDRVRHESPDPTTADAIYALGKVQDHHHLYREVGMSIRRIK